MSGSLLLDWAALSISLFNTLVLVWLGLTVLFNAERRTLGVWLATGGLLMGGAFFISHSAILGQRLDPTSPGLNFWWSAAWLPVILSPFAWYIVILWYSGYWDGLDTDLHRRQLVLAAELEHHRLDDGVLERVAGVHGAVVAHQHRPLATDRGRPVRQRRLRGCNRVSACGRGARCGGEPAFPDRDADRPARW